METNKRDYNRRGYAIKFKMFLEGVEVPFKTANIMCTPNGVEASIGVFANAELLKLKPKTAVQIFYRDWLNVSDPGWRLMFDGFFSAFQKMDQATQGMEIVLLCRDFRMDIRKAPAALAALWPSDLTAQNHYNAAGLYQKFVVPGKKTKVKDIYAYDFQGLADLPQVMLKIAGEVGATKVATPKSGQSAFKDLNGIDDGRFFLDAFIRGMWSTSVGGTAVGEYLNKRLRVDKRILVPMNAAGYRTWFKQSFGLEVGSYMMGDSRFSSIEAAIMRCAGLFMSTPHSCCTPTAIPIAKTLDDGAANPAIDYVIDPKVRDFIMKQDDFGGKYVLNETMLLPALEFSAPPACNMFFPPFCDRIIFNMDYDADFTRGYFDVHDSWSTKSADDLNKYTVQYPNALFSLYQDSTAPNKASDKLGKDELGRIKPPLTEEERYKGVSTFSSSVEYNMAASDACSTVPHAMFNAEVAAQIEEEKQELLKEKAEIESEVEDLGRATRVNKCVLAQTNSKISELQKLKSRASKGATEPKVIQAMQRHAAIKYLNAKFGGRVFTIDMMFNPYPMCGFPGSVMFDKDAYGAVTGSSVFGMVQQVKHLITISTSRTELSTTVVMSHCRFVDEPTDLDKYGQAIYMEATDPKAAEIDPKTYKYEEEKIESKFYIPRMGRTRFVIDPTNTKLDVKQQVSSETYKYVKDVLTLGADQLAGGTHNRLYLDKAYEPNRIAKFYKDVFGMPNNMMVGSAQKGDKSFLFMYDSMHEAAEMLFKNRPDLFRDYEASMTYVRRPVCSASTFYQGILGLSVKRNMGARGDEHIVYGCDPDEIDPDSIETEYFGITTLDFRSGVADGVTKFHGGTIQRAGDMSSIREHRPLTAFIHERKMAVIAYRDKVLERVESVHYQ